MREKQFLFLLLMWWVIFIPGLVKANERIVIAAVVGDEAITSADVKERLVLALFSSGLPPTAQVQDKLIPQILQLLIDEELYFSEAEKMGVSVSNEEVASAFADLEVKNNIEPGGLDDFLGERGISKTAVEEQLRAKLLWNKILSRKIRSRVKVTEREIEEKIEHISSESGISEFNISEIFVPFGDDNSEKAAQELAGKLYEEIRKGEDFVEIARNFSAAPSSASGGNMGWIEQNDLEGGLKSAAIALRKGEISQPVRLGDGYYIIKLNDRRALIGADNGETEVGLKQIYIPLKQDLSVEQKEELKERLNIAKAGVRNCDGFDVLAHKVNSNVDTKMVMSQLKFLNNEVRKAVDEVPIGVPTNIIEDDDGLRLFIVCERIKAGTTLAQKEKIKELLLQKKISLQARRFLRDLRRKTFIEVRI